MRSPYPVSLRPQVLETSCVDMNSQHTIWLIVPSLALIGYWLAGSGQHEEHALGKVAPEPVPGSVTKSVDAAPAAIGPTGPVDSPRPLRPGDMTEAQLLAFARESLGVDEIDHGEFMRTHCGFDRNWQYRPSVDELFPGPLDQEAEADVLARCYTVGDAHAAGIEVAADELYVAIQSALLNLAAEDHFLISPPAESSPRLTAAESRLEELRREGVAAIVHEVTVDGWSLALLADAHTFPDFGQAQRRLTIAKALRDRAMRQSVQ